MKAKRAYIIILCIILLLVLSSCNKGKEFSFNDKTEYKKALEKDYEQSNSNDVILLFKQSDVDQNKGSLYLSSKNKAELISDNVVNGQFNTIGKNNVVFCKSDNSLYLKTLNGSIKEILKNVDYYSARYSEYGGMVITQIYTENDTEYQKDYFINSDGDTYEIYDSKGNVDKYDDNYTFNYFKFLPDDKFFYTGSFDMLYKFEDGKIEKLASNVSDFSTTMDGSAYTYTTYDYNLFIKWCGAQKSEFIDTYVSYNVIMHKNGLSCFYTKYMNGSNEIYYVTPFTEPYKISNDASYYSLDDDNNILYYIDDEKLYSISIPDIKSNSKAEDINNLLNNSKDLILDNVSYFYKNINGRNVLINNYNNEFILLCEKEKVMLEANIDNFFFVEDNIVYLKDNKLKRIDTNGESTIIASDVNSCIQPYNIKNSVYYVLKDNSLYLYNGKESKVLWSNCSEYNSIMIEDCSIYEKSMDINDVVGCYINSDDEYCDYLIKIEKDKLTYYSDYDEKYTYTIKNTESNLYSITLYDDYENICTIYDEDGRLYLEFNNDIYFSAYIDRMTDEEYEEIMAEKDRIDSIFEKAYELFDNGFNEYGEHALYCTYDFSDPRGYYTIAGNWYNVVSYTMDDNNYLWLQIECNVEGNIEYLWINYEI